MEDILKQAQSQMAKVLALVESDLKSVKTGRAKPSLIEDIKINAYQTAMSLKELASISSPDPHELVVSPWDKTVLKAIETGINLSRLGISAIVDNDLVRIKIQPLTEETRRDLVKLVMQKLESGRRLLRQVRNEIKAKIEDRKGQENVSEDDIKAGLDDLQKLTNEFTAKIAVLGKTKENELMTI